MNTDWFKFNFVAECRSLKLEPWRCPPVLFIILSLVTIFSMLGTYVLTSRYFEEPEIPTVIIVSFLAIIFFIIGSLIISAFNKLVEANRLKTEFVSIVSHQLRSPLSVFKWTLDVLDRQNQNSERPSDEENFMQTLHITSEYMISLVNSLLEVSRIEAGTLVLKKENFSLIELTRELVNNFIKYAEASNIKLRLEPRSDLPAVTGDRERIGIVIQNLIDNSIRYSLGSGEVIIRIEKKEPWMEWSIEDKGIGIPESQQKYIFQKFFRGSNAKNNHPQVRGSGIGLYIAREVVEASHGSIGFTSQEGKGSKFWFKLPLKT